MKFSGFRSERNFETCCCALAEHEIVRGVLGIAGDTETRSIADDRFSYGTAPTFPAGSFSFRNIGRASTSFSPMPTTDRVSIFRRGAPSTGPSGPAARSAIWHETYLVGPERPRPFTLTCRSSGSRQPPITSRQSGDSPRSKGPDARLTAVHGQPDGSCGGPTRRSFCVRPQTILTGMAPRKSRLPMSTPQ